MTELKKRYSVVRVAWRRTGERQGWLRRRRWGLRSKQFGQAERLEVAAHLLAVAPIYADEAVYVYDLEERGRMVAAKYGHLWEQK